MTHAKKIGWAIYAAGFGLAFSATLAQATPQHFEQTLRL